MDLYLEVVEGDGGDISLAVQQGLLGRLCLSPHPGKGRQEHGLCVEHGFLAFLMPLGPSTPRWKTYDFYAWILITEALDSVLASETKSN